MSQSLPIVVILGRPNVGKSRLFNRLTGTRRSIVTDEPGITRDRIYGEYEWAGREFRVVDTGGIVPDDPELIPTEIYAQAKVALEEADALVLEFEVKSMLPWARKKLREVRIPYREIVLADFDALNRLVLRTARTLSMAEVPTSDKGEVRLSASKVWDPMSKRAAKRFVAGLNRRISGPSPRSQG